MELVQPYKVHQEEAKHGGCVSKLRNLCKLSYSELMWARRPRNLFSAAFQIIYSWKLKEPSHVRPRCIKTTLKEQMLAENDWSPELEWRPLDLSWEVQTFLPSKFEQPTTNSNASRRHCVRLVHRPHHGLLVFIEVIDDLLSILKQVFNCVLSVTSQFFIGWDQFCISPYFGANWNITFLLISACIFYLCYFLRFFNHATHTTKHPKNAVMVESYGAWQLLLWSHSAGVHIVAT